MRGDGGVDADDVAVHIDERSAAGTGIDGGVRLEEFLDADGVAQRDLAAVAGADDAVGDRLVQAKRAADGEHPAADFGGVAVAERCGGQGGLAVDGHDGEIAFGIGDDRGRAEDSAIGQLIVICSFFD